MSEPSDSRRVIDDRAVLVAAERGCPCQGARNCGCWNKALRLVFAEAPSSSDSGPTILGHSAPTFLDAREVGGKGRGWINGVRITPAGLRALADALERYGWPELKRRDT